MAADEKRKPTEPTEVNKEETARGPSCTPQTRTDQPSDTGPKKEEPVGPGYAPQERREAEQAGREAEDERRQMRHSIGFCEG